MQPELTRSLFFCEVQFPSKRKKQWFELWLNVKIPHVVFLSQASSQLANVAAFTSTPTSVLHTALKSPTTVHSEADPAAKAMIRSIKRMTQNPLDSLHKRR
jgi:hypothetical protein